jgi:protein-disulfide isomerase
MLLALGCSAQAPDVNRAIEHQIRTTFNIPSDVQMEIGPRKASDFTNYDTVTITLTQGERKQSSDFLISKDGKTLVRMTKMDLTKDPYTAIMDKISLQGRPVRGTKDARVTIVSYDDFQCPYCSKMHQELFQDIMGSYGDRVRVIYKDFPLPMHEWAIRAAVDANCLAAQSSDAYWEMADYVHANQGAISTAPAKPGDPPKRAALPEETAALDKLTLDYGQKHKLDMPRLEACVKAQSEDAVRASMREADALGVMATPTLFVNGEKVDGAVPPAMMREIVNRALREAGQPVPPPPAPSASKPAVPGR